MAIFNRDRVGRMFELIAPALDDFIARSVAPQLPEGTSWTTLVDTKGTTKGVEGKECHYAGNLQAAEFAADLHKVAATRDAQGLRRADPVLLAQVSDRGPARPHRTRGAASGGRSERLVVRDDLAGGTFDDQFRGAIAHRGRQRHAKRAARQRLFVAPDRRRARLNQCSGAWLCRDVSPLRRRVPARGARRQLRGRWAGSPPR